MMKDKVTAIIETFWQGRKKSLIQMITEQTKALDDMLTVEDHYRQGRSNAQQLQRSMGDFGGGTIDTTALATLFRKADDHGTSPAARLARMKALQAELHTLLGALDTLVPGYEMVTLQGEKADEVVTAYDRKIAPVVRVFSVLRKVALELRGKYDPRKHDAFYSTFDWRNLNNTEMALCPPYVVLAEPEELTGHFFGQLLQLVSTGRPIKLLVLQGKVSGDPGEIGRAAATKLVADIGFLSMSLRHVFVLQSSLALPEHLHHGLLRGLVTLRPSIFSLLSDYSRSNRPLEQRAIDALRSRAFPHFIFDPDQSLDFVDCLDVTGNPETDRHFATSELVYVDESGKEQKAPHTMTFADFIASEGILGDHFTPLAQHLDEASIMPLDEYLLKSHQQREGRTPYILYLDGNRRLVKMVPSKALIAQTIDRLHLWRALQELAGVENPHVLRARSETAAKFEDEKRRSIDEAKMVMENQLRQREDFAVASAMKNLALRLTGLDPAGFDLTVDPAALRTAAPSAATPRIEPSATPTAPAKPATPAGGSAWIDTPLCTSCDECVNINKSIFGYNADKKAFVKNPKGGPFKDIVKAAEKCSAGIIHPGNPQDPGEKNLDKLIEKAAKFQ